MPATTILWHDYETWGADPRRDRPSQFAAIRTNADLQVIGEPMSLYCHPSEDFLPHPEAVLVTGITPQSAAAKGVEESAFFGAINAAMMQAGTCSAGYNSIRFDDEVTRFGFWRNFIDPYAREWQNGNSRWDIIDLVRMAYALRPEGIQWPTRDDGAASFRLEDLTAANNIEHSGAHDALVDVRATIELARLIRKAQPRLYDFYFRLRRKDEATRLLNIATHEPVLHVSGMYPSERGCIAPVVPLLRHPVNANEVIVYDLTRDPQALLAMSADEMAENLYTRTQDYPEGVERVGLKGVHVNKSPALAPVATLNKDMARRWGIDWSSIEQHRAALLGSDTLSSRLLEVYKHRPEREQPDADVALYDGFISKHDRGVCDEVRSRSPGQLVDWEPDFRDERLQTLYPRFRARNWPELLDEDERQWWRSFCEARLRDGEFGCDFTLTDFQAELESVLQRSLTGEQVALMKQLTQWVSA